MSKEVLGVEGSPLLYDERCGGEPPSTEGGMGIEFKAAAEVHGCSLQNDLEP